MARPLLVLCLAAWCFSAATATTADVSTAAALPSNRRMLLSTAPNKPAATTAAAVTPAATSKPLQSSNATQSKPLRSSGNATQTCCNCKCVIPAKDMRSPECKATPGCVGMGAPTYSQKNICAPGANRSCDSVCIKDMGSWTSYYEC